MAFNKRTWLGRQGTGLNKFSIGGATPVTIVNQPDSVTQVGDALSAGNLNDLEDRIEDAFDDVDTALDTKADEQDVTNLNNAINQLDHRVENLEQAKGDYIVSAYKDGSITPSGKGNWAVVEGLRGVSRVENQLSRASATHTQNDVVVTKNADGSVTLNGTASASGSLVTHESIPVISGHTYLLYVVGNTSKSAAYTNINTNHGTQGEVVTASSSGNKDFTLRCDSGVQFNNDIYWLIATDLNIYFNTSDLSFLGATDSAKLATIQTNYPHLLIPTEYGTRVIDWTGNGVRAWARNLWDEEWEVGAFDSQGEKKTGNYIISKNLIPVSPNTTYYSKAPASMWVREYDREGTYLGIYKQGYDTTFTTSAQTYYVSLELYGNAPYTTYGHNICLNVSDSLNGTYTPYHAPSTLSFPSTTLKSAGSVRDTLELNVEVDGVAKKRETERTDSYTFTGEEEWTYNSTFGVFFVNISGKANGITNLMSSDYVVDATATNWTTMADKCIRGDSSENRIYIKDSAYSSTSTFASHMTGKKINFERATYVETLSDPLIDNTLLTESGGRMATVQTGTVVDGIADLGFITL